MRTGREAFVFRGHSDLVTNLTFSPNGRRLASTSLDQTVRVWDARPLDETMGRELLSLPADSRAVFRGIVFSPDGNRLASGGADNTVRIWEVGTWKDLHTLSGHTDDVAGVAFSADGRRHRIVQRQGVDRLGRRDGPANRVDSRAVQVRGVRPGRGAHRFGGGFRRQDPRRTDRQRDSSPPRARVASPRRSPSAPTAGAWLRPAAT